MLLTPPTDFRPRLHNVVVIFLEFSGHYRHLWLTMELELKGRQLPGSGPVPLSTTEAQKSVYGMFVTDKH